MNYFCTVKGELARLPDDGDPAPKGVKAERTVAPSPSTRQGSPLVCPDGGVA